MKKNNVYYNFEFCLFSWEDVDIFDLIIANYLREILVNINSDIFVISKNMIQFNSFYKRIEHFLTQLTIEEVYEFKKSNGLVKKYLENHDFKLKDLEYLQNNILKKLHNVDNDKKYYDIVILDESFTKQNLKKLVLEKTRNDKDVSILLNQCFIYIVNYQKEFKKIYDYFD